MTLFSMPPIAAGRYGEGGCAYGEGGAAIGTGTAACAGWTTVAAGAGAPPGIRLLTRPPTSGMLPTIDLIVSNNPPTGFPRPSYSTCPNSGTCEYPEICG